MATLRVSGAVRDHAVALARDEGTTVGEIVSTALDGYARERFWEQTRQALNEISSMADEGWERTVPDGLTDE